MYLMTYSSTADIPSCKSLRAQTDISKYTAHIVAKMDAGDKVTSIGNHRHILIVLRTSAEHINIGLYVGLQG